MTRVLLALAGLLAASAAAISWQISRGDPGRLFICSCPADQRDPDCTVHQPDRSTR